MMAINLRGTLWSAPTPEELFASRSCPVAATPAHWRSNHGSTYGTNAFHYNNRRCSGGRDMSGLAYTVATSTRAFLFLVAK